MVVLFALSTFVSTALGGLVALRSRDRLHLILGFTAGVLLGLVAFDLLPEVFELSDATLGGVPTAMVTFVAGFLALHLVERWIAIHRAHEGEYETHSHVHPQVGLVSAFALAGHSFLDGLSIGLGFQVNDRIGLTVAVAVVAHDFADGLNTVGIMLRHRNSRRRAVAMLVVDAVAPVVGAFVTLFVSVPQTVLGLYLGFFAGFLLYLATSDILPEAHARHPSRLTVLCTICGVALMWGTLALT